MKREDLIILIIVLLLLAGMLLTIFFGGEKSMHGVGRLKNSEDTILNSSNPNISQRLSREVGKGCGYEACVEKHPQALTESLFSRLPISMLRMYFKRNEVDTMLSGFIADRL